MTDMELTSDTLKTRIKGKYFNKKRDAQDRGISFSLSYVEFEELATSKKCYYSGMELGLDNLTIDRVDSKKGYHKFNCVAAHANINVFKSRFEQTNNNMSLERAFTLIGKFLKAKKKTKGTQEPQRTVFEEVKQNI